MFSSSRSAVLGMRLERSSPTPLHQQLYLEIRSAMLAGRIRAGERLPSTRDTASMLGISRNTVLGAYAQLFGEGFVEGRVGSGTYVANALPRKAPAWDDGPGPASEDSRLRRPISSRGALIAATSMLTSSVSSPWARGISPRAFHPALPALDSFPYDMWSRLVARRWRHLSTDLQGYTDPAGYLPLRRAIADYLREERAMDCDEDQVIIVAGSQQGLDLASRVLLDVGDEVWLEDPGYPGARHVLLAAGAHLAPVPVDKEGLDVAAGAALGREPSLIYVTPSYQYPLGVTMSLARRLELLEFANQRGAWVLEDDYNSEYRYAGRPVAALQGLDRESRVIYIGTFSKVLLPSLRIGYVVAPKDLVAAFTAARALADRQSPSVEQAALADFISEGYFIRHIRRMRELYKRRQASLLHAADLYLRNLVHLDPSDAGMHLVGGLEAGIDDLVASRRAALHGLEVRPLSMYCTGRDLRRGLLLGYAAINEREIMESTRRLATALRSIRSWTETSRAA